MTENTNLPAVTRIARRRARPGHAREYEALVREMFQLMRQQPGFLGAELIPPETEDGLYQVVVNYASEDDLSRWDGSAERREIFARMRPHAEGEPEHRRLSALDEWFFGPSVPRSTVIPRWKSAIVTWMGIWPLASLVLYVVAPIWQRLGVPFFLSTAINVTLIVVGMVYFVSPLLTKAMQWFLVPRRS